MKKWFAATAAMLSLVVMAGAAELPQVGGFLDFEPSGDFQVDNLAFHLTHFGQDWTLTTQNPSCVTPAKGFPAVTAGSFRLNGQFKVSNGVFQLSETVTSRQPNQADFNLQLSSREMIFTNDLAIQVLLPCDRYLDVPILADGKKINFPKQYNADDAARGLRVKNLVLPLDRGTLTISGDFGIRFQDNRLYKIDEWALRIQPERKTPSINGASLRLKLSYTPLPSTAVDLRKVANAGLTDEVASDAKGGWTDQGPGNDLRSFKTGPGEYAGINFNVIDQASNNGRSIIALRGRNCLHYPTTVTVELPQPTAAKYLYILSALGWEPLDKVEIGTITCEYDDTRFVSRSEGHFKVVSGVDTANFWMPRQIKNAAIGWRGINPSARIGLYVTRFQLSGKPVKRITFESNGAAEWFIPAITLTDRKVDPALDIPLVMQPDSDWVEFKNRKDVKSGSILDFSDLLDAPAGKYGRLRSVNGRTEFEKRPGIPARFYGANIAYDVHFMEKEKADKLAELCARTGYNLIRFHHFDRQLVERSGGNCTTPDADRLDRMDYLLSALKKRGIYTTIDLFTMREIAAGEFPENPDWAPALEEYKALIFISDAAMKNYQEFSANLLNHVNPYTGYAWKDEPAIITISMINEDTLTNIAFSTPRVAKLYQERFDAWLKKRGITTQPDTLSGYRRQFLAETYLEGFRKLEAFYDQLGVRALLTDQNYVPSIPSSVLREQYDYVDLHFYWSHPQFLGGNWGLPTGINNESAIKHYAGGVNEMFPGRNYGKPFAVTEWDYVNPNDYVVEGAFLTGAYAALQDWSILCRFTYIGTEQNVNNDLSLTGFFEIINDPLRRLSEAAGLMTFLRGDVKASEVNFPFLVSNKYFDNPRNPDWYPKLVGRLGLIGKTGSLIAAPGKCPELPPATRAVISTPGSWDGIKFPVPFLDNTADIRDSLQHLQQAGAITQDEYDPKNDRFRSSTGELLLNCGRGTFQITTPRSESFLLGEDQNLAGKFAAVSNRQTFGAFLIAARDELPLETSRRILLLHLTATRNTEQRFQNAEAHVLESWGRPPLLIRRGEADMVINRDLSGFKLYAVGLDGSRAMEIPLKIEGGKTSFTLRNITPNGIFAAYELISE